MAIGAGAGARVGGEAATVAAGLEGAEVCGADGTDGAALADGPGIALVGPAGGG